MRVNKKMALGIIGALLTLLLSCGSDSDKTKIIETYPDGSPKSVQVYLSENQGKAYIVQGYYPDGALEFEAKVVDDKYVIYKESYYNNGHPREIVQLFKPAKMDDCCPDGEYRRYYSNGNLKETHTLKEGVFNGAFVAYDSLGAKIEEHNLVGAMKNGISHLYHPSGEVSAILKYRNDTLIGTSYYFNENGDSLRRHENTEGRLGFPIKYWEEDGRSLLGERSGDGLVRWTWIDSSGIVLKEDVVKAVDGKFVRPEF